ncbi:hypothetical protein [Stenotrophomonas maltophilia]|nr:hypothetical protein [Stenotrophomonas maltophilia]
MKNNATPLDHSRKQKQQQKPKPAPGARKAAISKQSQSTAEFKEIPKGYVVRSGDSITAKAVRNVGPKDMEILEHAITAFGHLLKPFAVQTLAGFASLIELDSGTGARKVADTLHRLSA